MVSIGTTLSPIGKKALLCGSGELGKEVAVELQRYGVEVVALDRYPDAPAMQVAHRSYVVSMLDGARLREIVEREKPDYIIPFKLDKKAAKEGLVKHLHGKILLPKVFKKENHIDEIKGVYVPFWLFDTDASADIRYHATKTRFWSDSDYDYTETSHYSVFRAGNIGFDQIPVDGSSKIDNDLTESLEPYVISEAVDFATPYLAGYVADKYDVSAEESAERANQRVRKAAEDAFRDTVIGYDSVTPEDTRIQLKGGKTHYALFPVWLLSTTWKGNHYLFGMNGQTGKFVGNLPVDKGIFTKWFLGLTAGFSVAAYAIAWLIHTFC